MTLARLHLQNFRGFLDTVIDLHPRLTILVGANGSGKSSVLDAIRIIRAEMLNKIFSWEVTDVRNGSVTAQIDLLGGSAGAAPWQYHTAFRLAPHRGGNGAWIQFDESGGSERLMLFYSVRRALLKIELDAPGDDGILARPAAYQGALDGGGSFDAFLRWFRAREDLENELRLRENPGHRDGQLQAVRRALTGMMPGYENLYVQRHPRQQIVLSKKGDSLTINQLSDGEKCLLATVGDIARRLALAAPEGVDPLQTAAVVMIDEVELHLHPGWQRAVVPALLRTFPGVQFILTTHSPQVLSEVATESIRLLEDFQVCKLDQPVRGRDSNALLREVFNVTERPRAALDALDALGRLIDDEKLDEARDALQKLRGELGAHDTEIVRYQTLLDFLTG